MLSRLALAAGSYPLGPLQDRGLQGLLCNGLLDVHGGNCWRRSWAQSTQEKVTLYGSKYLYTYSEPKAFATWIKGSRKSVQKTKHVNDAYLGPFGAPMFGFASAVNMVP